MSEPSGGFKLGAILWALLIGAGIVLLAGSIMLPSTKRARVDLDELRRVQAEEDASAAAATLPSTAPATTTSVEPSPAG